MFGKRLVALIIVCAVAFGIEAKEKMLVLCPVRPEGFSQGEMGVIIDAVNKQITGHGKFEPISRSDAQEKLAEKNLLQVSACEDGGCFVAAGELVGAGYVYALRISPIEDGFTVRSRLISLPSGTVVGKSSHSFEGAKTTLALRYVPTSAAELLKKTIFPRRSEPVVQKNTQAPAKTKTPPASKEEQPKDEGTQVDKVTKASTPQAGSTPAPTRNFNPAAIVVPVAIAIPAAIVAIYLVRKGQEDEPAEDVMALPEFPDRGSSNLFPE